MYNNEKYSVYTINGIYKNKVNIETFDNSNEFMIITDSGNFLSIDQDDNSLVISSVISQANIFQFEELLGVFAIFSNIENSGVVKKFYLTIDGVIDSSSSIDIIFDSIVKIDNISNLEHSSLIPVQFNIPYQVEGEQIIVNQLRLIDNSKSQDEIMEEIELIRNSNIQPTEDERNQCMNLGFVESCPDPTLDEAVTIMRNNLNSNLLDDSTRTTLINTFDSSNLNSEAKELLKRLVQSQS